MSRAVLRGGDEPLVALLGLSGDHKVDGRTTPAATATVTVAMDSTPLLKSTESGPKDTYGVGETIKIVITASEAVEVLGDPAFLFQIGDSSKRAAYDPMKSTGTKLLFTYEVQADDTSERSVHPTASCAHTCRAVPESSRRADGSGTAQALPRAMPER